MLMWEMWVYLWKEDKWEKNCGFHQQCQPKKSSVHLVEPAQSKLNNYQQSQNNTIHINNDSNLQGVVENLYLNSTGVESHEHGP